MIETIVNYIINQGINAIQRFTSEKDFFIDYVAIFSKDEKEYKNLERIVEEIGIQVQTGTAKTGKTIKLNKPIKTESGILEYIKIRKPDDTRPQRGAPDFQIQNYNKFKEKYLGSNGNFTLMPRKSYEMIEIKGVDVLVYIPSKTINQRLAES